MHKFHFCRVGGERLCTVDYGDLPPPYNRAVVTLPNVAHHAILDAIEREPSVSLRYRSTFTGLLREKERVVGLTAKQGDVQFPYRPKWSSAPMEHFQKFGKPCRFQPSCISIRRDI
ncbi:MAG: hypothetical protein HC938_09305 [Nitrospira sp.]|nr:hypothetical protein [Nitrospira sp.]